MKTLIHNTSSDKGKRKMEDFSDSTSKEVKKSMKRDGEGSSVTKVGSFSVLSFLHKVFKDELGDHRDCDSRKYRLLELTVRAAFFESGFLMIGPVSNSVYRHNNLNARRHWYLPAYYYTLPKIITSCKTKIEAIKIKFQSIGNYCRIYGCLIDGTTVHSVVVNKARLVLFATVVWANWEQVVVCMRSTNQVTDIQPKKEVLNFWKQIKDELVLPLLADLSEKVGFEPPSCFMQLPTDLKLKILESVSGVDLARVSCVCSKFRRLVSNDRLWKHKFFEKYGEFSVCENEKRPFKLLYGLAWKNWRVQTYRPTYDDRMFEMMFFML